MALKSSFAKPIQIPSARDLEARGGYSSSYVEQNFGIRGLYKRVLRHARSPLYQYRELVHTIDTPTFEKRASRIKPLLLCLAIQEHSIVIWDT